MSVEKMDLWEILVPTVHRITGKPYRTRFHRVWDTKVREITGGLTILQPVKGQWVSPNKELFVERMIPVRISCSHSQMQRIINMTAEYYEQLAVMAYRISECCIIQHFPEKKK